MCLNCGCGTPDDRHGDPANITLADLERAGEANGQTLAETSRNMTEALDELSMAADTSGAPASR